MPFDLKLAIAEMQTDTTDAYRERYPELVKVWNELDDLRDQQSKLGEAQWDLEQAEQELSDVKTAMHMVDGMLAALIQNMDEGPLREQLDAIWHEIP